MPPRVTRLKLFVWEHTVISPDMQCKIHMLCDGSNAAEIRFKRRLN